MCRDHMALDDLHVLLPADLSNQLSHPQPNVSCQHGLPILRYPHQVQVNRENGMRPLSAFVHSPILTPNTC